MARMSSRIATVCVWFVAPTLGFLAAWSQQPQSTRHASATEQNSRLSAQLHTIFFGDMSAYNFYLDADNSQIGNHG
jgi:hypothetical protein